MLFSKARKYARLIRSMDKKIDGLRKSRKELDLLDVHNAKLDRLIEDNLKLRELIQSNMIAMEYLAFGLSQRDGEEPVDVRKRAFAQMPPAPMTIRLCQCVGLILLNALDDRCRQASVDYWLDGGALLGVVRNGACVPWDDDIDVCMTRREFERLKVLFEDDQDFFIDERYSHTLTKSMNHTCQLKIRNAPIPVSLDIFLYDYVDEVANLDEIAYRVNALRREHRQQAWALYGELVGSGDLSENSAKVQGALKDLLNSYQKKAFDELALTREPAAGMVWAIDNTGLPRNSQQLCCAVHRVMPLSEGLLEGRAYPIPRCIEERLIQKFEDIYTFPRNIYEGQHFRLIGDAERHAMVEIVVKYRERYLSQIDDAEINILTSWKHVLD